MPDAPDAAFALDRFLPYRVNVLASRISRRLAAVYEQRFGISIPEWRVLAHLAANQKISVREIFERADMDKSKISRAAANLEGAGLIEKRSNASDRRLLEMSLTDEGRRLFAQIAPLALDYEAQLLDRLSAEERDAFDRALTKLNAALADPP
ncbi:MAG: MarR family transcriptional regulator [Alphaproteobacteria bacterium]